jgi:hypothetical protein
MKKIYFSFAILLALVSQTKAQHADVLEGLTIPVSQVDVSSVQAAKEPTGEFSTTACDTLGTTFAAGNGQNGNFFDLVNTNTLSIQITDLSQCFSSTATDTIYVYYKSGTFVGSEATPSAWTLATKMAYAPSFTGTPEVLGLGLNIVIPSGQTYGMYVTLRTQTVRYTNGLTMGATYKTKDGLEFKEGKGVQYPWGSTFPTSGTSSRIWNGVLHYCTMTTTGISELNSENSLSVYPNPANGHFTVKNNSAVQLNNATLTVKDMTGRLVYSQKNINADEINITTDNFKSGLYILQVENENVVIITQKISVQ